MKNLNRSTYAVTGVCVLLMAGMVYAWSVMAKSIGAANPDWSKAQLSLTFTLVMGMFCIGSLFAGIFSKKIKARIFVWISAVLYVAGFYVASLTSGSPVLLYIGYGVLCGLATGMAYNATMGTVCAWYPDKQGTISGILLMGFGLSSFIIGKIFAAVTPSDGGDEWCATFRVLGIVIFVVLAISGFFMKKPDAAFKPPVPKNKKPVREPASDVGTLTMMKSSSFWMMYVWAIMVSAAGLVLISQASGIAMQVSSTVSDGTIATVVGLISVMNGVGRIFMGMMYDKLGYKITMLVDMICFFATEAILLVAIVTSSFPILVVAFLVGGFAYSGVTPMQSAVISDFYGRTNYSANFSVIVTNLMIASFASTVAGKLFDITNSFFSVCIMMIVVTVVAMLAFFGVRRPSINE